MSTTETLTHLLYAMRHGDNLVETLLHVQPMKEELTASLKDE